MPISDQKKRVKFESSGFYRIEIQGMLDENWSDRLAGMQIIPDERETVAPVTRLVGHLRDQAQLFGVLNTLYELHLPILLVRYTSQNDKGTQ